MAPDTPDERRVVKRETVLKTAKIVFGASVVDCVVQNISATGARVRTGSVVPVPDRVVLQLRDGTSYAALRAWTRGTQIGFRFVANDTVTRAPVAILGTAA